MNAALKSFGSGAAAGAAAAAPVPAAPAAAAPPFPGGQLSTDGTPPISVLDSQCDLPPSYRGLAGGASWLDRKVVPVQLLLAGGGAGAAVPSVTARAYSTLYPGSRSHLGGTDVWALVGSLDYDPKALALMRAIFSERSGTAFIDIGAWLGVTTLYAGFLGASRVLSLEADPRAFEELFANVKLNPAVAERTWVYRHCVSDRAEVRSVKSVLGSTVHALGVWDPKTAPADEAEVSWQVPCSTLPTLAQAHALAPVEVGLVRLNAAPGTELHIAGGLLDWVSSVPAGAPKPAVWMTLHSHKWGDKTLGHHAVMPLVRAYKFAYNSRLEPLDLSFAERKGEGPCPETHGACNVLVSDMQLNFGGK